MTKRHERLKRIADGWVHLKGKKGRSKLRETLPRKKAKTCRKWGEEHVKLDGLGKTMEKGHRASEGNWNNKASWGRE